VEKAAAKSDESTAVKADPTRKPKPNAKSGAKAPKNEGTGEIVIDPAQGAADVNACADESADPKSASPSGDAEPDDQTEPQPTAAKPHADDAKLQTSVELAAELTVSAETPAKLSDPIVASPGDASHAEAKQPIPQAPKVRAGTSVVRSGAKPVEPKADGDTEEDLDAPDGVKKDDSPPDAPQRAGAPRAESRASQSKTDAGVTSLPVALEHSDDSGARGSSSKKASRADPSHSKDADVAPQPTTAEAQPGTVKTIVPSAAAPPAVPAALTAPAPATHASTAHATPPIPLAQSAPPEVDFAAANHGKIVTGIRGDLLPGGGTMQIRLDPPELGALQISVRMQDGVMTASFQTSTDDATKLLSHSLSQLKTVLETQGVSVEKLHVEQAPREQRSDNDRNQSQQHPNAAYDQTSARQDQQRKEMLRRMWRRLSFGSDPLDMVA
jgi:flagellar hook-length control protein FliK